MCGKVRIAVLTVAALAMPARGIQGGAVDYIVSEDTATDLKVTGNHPNSTLFSRTIPVAPTLTNWSVGGTLKDNNAGLFSRGVDTIVLSGGTVARTAGGGGPTFNLPLTTGAGGLVVPATINWIKFAQSKPNAAGGFDNVEVVGSLKSTPTTLGGSDINSYNFVVIGSVTNAAARFALATALAAANEPTPGASAAYGSLAALYFADTNDLKLEIGMSGLQATDITDIQITSNSPGFTTLDLGTSGLVNGSSGDVAFGGDFVIPSADLAALEAGNAFVNVLTENNPNGEIGGMLSAVQFSAVPEPSSIVLLASGLAGLAWLRRKMVFHAEHRFAKGVHAGRAV
jgi:hypothetical protein